MKIPLDTFIAKTLFFAPKNILTTLYLKPSNLVTAAIGLH